MAIVRHKPYDRTTHDGKRVNWRTKAMILEAEEILGYKLSVLQGGYNVGGVAASAGTHDGGGALDLTDFDWRNKVKALRQVGFAAWYRPNNWDGKGGMAHIHAIALDDAQASQGAKNQMVDYRNFKSGLASGATDTFKPHPDKPFDYAKWQNTRILNLRIKRLVKRRVETNEQILAARARLRKLQAA